MGTEVSPLPSRALHTSPMASLTSDVTIVDAPSGVIMRKHPKQSLSQPTIPEEEGEEASNEALTPTVTSVLMKPKPNPVVNNLAQELGAFSKDMASSLKKSSSFKEEKSSANTSSNVASASSLDSLNTEIKSSPKLTRTESIGERTMQKISKVIRGSSRSESRSKKTRETSLSPSGSSKESSSRGKKDLSSKEKRDLFKSGSGQ